jgi:hypothetical protein
VLYQSSPDQYWWASTPAVDSSDIIDAVVVNSRVLLSRRMVNQESRDFKLVWDHE